MQNLTDLAWGIWMISLSPSSCPLFAMAHCGLWRHNMLRLRPFSDWYSLGEHWRTCCILGSVRTEVLIFETQRINNSINWTCSVKIFNWKRIFDFFLLIDKIVSELRPTMPWQQRICACVAHWSTFERRLWPTLLRRTGTDNIMTVSEQDSRASIFNRLWNLNMHKCAH